MSLEESLRFVPLGEPPGHDGSGSMNPVGPAKSGLQLCAVPGDTTGLAFLCTPLCELQALRIPTNDDQGGPTILFRTSLPALPLHCSATADGRLVAVALGDGSLRCYDATAGGFRERWNLPNAHAHRMRNWSHLGNHSFGASRHWANSMVHEIDLQWHRKI